MNRDKLEFKFLPTELHAAAIQQRDFRLSRVKAWAEAKEKVMAEVGASGIEVSESAMQAKLAECHAKIQEHAKAASEYAAWAQLFAVRATPMMLTYADYLYFFPNRQTEAQS